MNRRSQRQIPVHIWISLENDYRCILHRVAEKQDKEEEEEEEQQQQQETAGQEEWRENREEKGFPSLIRS